VLKNELVTFNVRKPLKSLADDGESIMSAARITGMPRMQVTIIFYFNVERLEGGQGCLNVRDSGHGNTFLNGFTVTVA
jgi:hypothetical protein